MAELIRFYLVSLFLGLAALPFLPLRSPKDAEALFALSRTLGPCLLALFLCIICLSGVGIWSGPALALSVSVAICAWFAFLYLHRKNLAEYLHSLKKAFIRTELPSFVLFLFACALVATSPAIVGTEKPMDFAILNSVFHSSRLPPPDLWFSGKTLSYYWFGHLQAALMCHLSGISPDTGYNLMLALTFSLIFQATFSLFRILGTAYTKAVAGALMVVLAGNLVPIYFVFCAHGHSPFDLWAPSRIIPGTITEFPFFSLLVGDLHAHYVMLPSFIAFASLLLRNRDDENSSTLQGTILLNALIVCTALGNPWNIAPMVILFFVSKILGITRLPWWALVPSLVLCPFLIPTGGHHLGIGLVKHGSPLSAFLLVWGLPLVMMTAWRACSRFPPLTWPILLVAGALLWLRPVAGMLFVFLAMQVLLSKREGILGKGLAAVSVSAILCLLVTEFFYLKDIYVPPYERMNTVFKLSYCAWPLLMTSGLVSVFRSVKPLEEKAGGLSTVALSLLVALGLAYPCVAIAKKITSLNYQTLTLNGLRPLRQSFPDDLAAIDWLRTRARPGDVCLEAPGTSYTWSSRISTFTGCATLRGWEQHEFLWRGDSKELERRKRDINAIYTCKNKRRCLELLSRYGVNWIVRCDLEKRLYGTEWERQMQGIVKKRFRKGNCTIYSVDIPGDEKRGMAKPAINENR